jgi:hypothetical protein
MPIANSILGRQLLAVSPSPVAAYSLRLTQPADIQYRYQCWQAAEFAVGGSFFAFAGQSVYYQGGTLILPPSSLDIAIVAYWPRAGIEFEWSIA